AAARIGALVQAATDPFTGQPEMKATRVALTRETVAADGFLIARRALPVPDGLLWTKVAVAGGAGLLFAATEPPDAPALLRLLAAEGCTIAEVSDPARGLYRAAAYRDEELEAVVFTGPGARAAWTVVEALFGQRSLDAAERRALLSGRAAGGMPDPGPTICACFSVGLAAVGTAIAAGAADVDAVGRATKAGTNCGSCRSEIKKILAQLVNPVPA
ncbi:MAG: (2Fe-2S)-binding protein, partial [Phreatobacter sp.]|uniref:(2Fe-2S)-binding protein n=1 Tax=Phreatobacter sp. TaxID=1966341 RepID=UPI004035A496